MNYEGRVYHMTEFMDDVEEITLLFISICFLITAFILVLDGQDSRGRKKMNVFLLQLSCFGSLCF